MTDVTIPAALLAGILSFLSPCVLPLVPPYLCFLAGTSIEEFADRDEKVARRDVVLAALLFVAGFSTVFILLGATASVLGQVIRQHLDILSMLAGAAIILMGLHFLGIFRIGMLYREARVTVAKPVGVWGAYVMGLAFAFGWTPCIGPILAAILAVAGSEDTVLKGAGLLAIYSIGLGVPFLIAALTLEPFTLLMRRYRSKLALVEKAMGVLLVATGIGFLTGQITQMSFWLLETFPALGRLG
jgi:cytochrome c-type biogenesis protein